MHLHKALKTVCDVCPGFPTNPTSKPVVVPSTSAQSFTISSLEGLPKELLWELLEYVPECVRNIRATSQTMRRYVAEHAMRHPSEPMVQYLRISRSPKHNMQLELTIPRSAATLFELRIIGNSSLFSQIGRVRGSDENRYYIYLYPAHDTSVVEHLCKCIGRPLEKVEILDWDNRSLFYPTITNLLGDKHFGNLEIKFETITERDVEELLKPLRDCLIDQTILTVRHVKASSPENELLELSSFFQSIRIGQLYIPKMGKRSAYFFGLHDFEWSSIIPEMFSRKMDKLYISNFHYPQYLSAKCAATLLEQLPLIGKKVWFVASCEALVTYFNQDNDYSSEGDLSTDGYFLRIKHPSRRDE